MRFILLTFSDVKIQWKQQDQENVYENANDAVLKISSYFRKAEQEYRDTLYKLGSKDLSPREFHCPRNQGVRERPNKNCGGKNLRRRKDDRVTPISAGHEQHGGHQPRRFTDQENGFKAVEKPPALVCSATSPMGPPVPLRYTHQSVSLDVSPFEIGRYADFEPRSLSFLRCSLLVHDSQVSLPLYLTAFVFFSLTIFGFLRRHLDEAAHHFCRCQPPFRDQRRPNIP